MRSLNSVLFSAFVACSTLAYAGQMASLDAKYYFGDVAIRSPDGKTSYGKTVSLVKRVIDPDKNQIIEFVLQPPRLPQQKPKEIKTTLTRLANSSEFSAEDDDRTFTGKMNFSGTEWSWDRWTYEIELKNGSRLTGSGTIDSSGLKTEKIFVQPDGTTSVLIKEDLKAIEQREYDRHRAEMICSQ